MPLITTTSSHKLVEKFYWHANFYLIFAEKSLSGLFQEDFIFLLVQLITLILNHYLNIMTYIHMHIYSSIMEAAMQPASVMFQE